MKTPIVPNGQKLLQDFMARWKLTPSGLSDLTGLSPSLVVNTVKGRRELTVLSAVAILNALAIPEQNHGELGITPMLYQYGIQSLKHSRSINSKRALRRKLNIDNAVEISLASEVSALAARMSEEQLKVVRDLMVCLLKEK